ncbi:hypothetical protein M9H77_37115 [Catharanthus roseus]|uniref:Uncharacterized protein n=1 Tax=Catharanthus roseus TaxID=4058 RepID=A0ACB9ZU53_CATRO|nr:hypothetical protein M9H77_37115 [Catharanthus roseus]
MISQDLLSCEVTSSKISSSAGHRCDGNKPNYQCRTFAVLRTNSYYSSLSNLSLSFGINRFALAEANGFSTGTEFLPLDQPLLIPIDCKCRDGLFGAELIKTTLKGESFNGIVQSLEGLTTCKAIQEKNPNAQQWNLGDKQHLIVPVDCGCSSKLLLSYPVSQGDTLVTLASTFNTTPEDILSANDKSRTDPRSEILVPFSTVLIPVQENPRFGPWLQPSLPIINQQKKKRKKAKMRKIGVYIAVSVVVFGATIAIAATFLLIQRKRQTKQAGSVKAGGDVELQQLSLSVRTTSEKKVSFEGSNDDSIINGHIMDHSTPHKALIETYTIEELKKATEDFSSTNLIEDSVYHGRLNGKDLAIKRTPQELISKIEFGLFCDAMNHHPNIIRLIGTCIIEGSDSYLVFEYAKNGSLKDWLHGGLAMKSQFIASCDCFLTWKQRLKICLDVAAALQFMQHIMNPPYIHKNIKTRNIFLDEEFNAKLGNFGMAKCVVEAIEQDPSMDIYAYGVILLEILSAEKPKIEEEGGKVGLSEKIKVILKSENAEELKEWIDKALGENYSFDGAVTLANLARSCVEDDPSLRPSAGEIMEKLSRLVEEEEELIRRRHHHHHVQLSISSSESSCKPLV